MSAKPCAGCGRLPWTCRAASSPRPAKRTRPKFALSSPRSDRPAEPRRKTALAMDDSLRLETEKLARSWRQYDAPFLRDYLVADVEDPRINVQSILSRHFLIATLFGEKFRELGLQELRFAGAMNWLANLAKNSGGGAEESRAVLHALEHGADNAEGLQIPHFISETFRSLPICLGEITILNYIRDFLV